MAQTSKLGNFFMNSQLGKSPLFFIPSLFMPLLTIISTIGALYWTSPDTWSHTFFATTSIWYAFIYVPLMDSVLGDDVQQPSKNKSIITAYEAILYSYVPLQLSALAFACHHLCTSTTINPSTFILMTIGCGISNGVLFTVAHELLHHPKRIDKLLSSLLLSVCCYQHWQVSHLQHHVKVATVDDPSTARRNESIYMFIPRSVVGNLVDGFSHERARRERKNIPLFSIQNRALWWVTCPLMIATLITMLYGIKGTLFFIGQAVGGVIMLELVNYIEHYGLQREKDPKTQRYERVSPNHSWNATTLFSNAITFRLQRHSSHHADSSLAYYNLENAIGAPTLPVGYSGMLLLALVPPVFFRVMNGILDEYLSKKKKEENKENGVVMVGAEKKSE